jgi:cell division protein FtsA
LRKGIVVNIERTIQSIKDAIEEAEVMADCHINTVVTGIAGEHVKGFNSHGVIGIKNGEVRRKDVKRVIEAARTVPVPKDRQVIHILPQEFIVDDQQGIQDPLGMSAVRLEAKVHVVTGATSSARNLVRCTHRTGLDVRDLVLQPLASSESVLHPDEKELGVLLIDIGGGTTDIALFHGGSIRRTFVLPFGGNYLTSDVAIGLRTSMAEAEKVKETKGCAIASHVPESEMIAVEGIGQQNCRNVPRRFLCEIIQARIEEILQMAYEKVYASGHIGLLGSGVVLTGGSSLLAGIEECAQRIFDLPARVGHPSGVGGLCDKVNSPVYATAVGLVLCGRNRRRNGFAKNGSGNLLSKITERMKAWFEEAF